MLLEGKVVHRTSLATTQSRRQTAVEIVGSIRRARKAIATRATPPKVRLIPTRSPTAQAAVPGRPAKMMMAMARQGRTSQTPHPQGRRKARTAIAGKLRRPSPEGVHSSRPGGERLN